MDIEYIPDDQFRAFIWDKGIGKDANMINVDGHARWEITREDNTKYIVRPLSSKKEI